jgi:hypothetical protein
MNWLVLVTVAAAVAGGRPAQADSLTYSHTSSSLPGASGPAITLLSITGTNDGTNYLFTLTFANPTIEGPSSGNADAVYGFINIDADRNAMTGVTGAFLDANSYEPGFGQYTPGSLGIDAFINLVSEGDPLHGAPGLVDIVATNGFAPLGTASVTYQDQVGSTPSTLTVSIPLSLLASNQISPLGAGDFSVVVGNVDNATDFLPGTSAVPEPGSILLLASGMFTGVLIAARSRRGESRLTRPKRTRDDCG